HRARCLRPAGVRELRYQGGSAPQHYARDRDCGGATRKHADHLPEVLRAPRDPAGLSRRRPARIVEGAGRRGDRGASARVERRGGRGTRIRAEASGARSPGAGPTEAPGDTVERLREAPQVVKVTSTSPSAGKCARTVAPGVAKFMPVHEPVV